MKQKRAVKDAGAESGPRVVTIEDLMTSQVMTTTRHQTVGHVKKLMAKHGINAMPIVNAEGEPEGIISSSDLIESPSDETPLGKFMTPKVYVIPQYSGLHIAARVMRNHKIHHLIVTHEKKIVGILSSFDLLRLVEDKRFVIKNLPSESKKKLGKRGKKES